MKDVFDLNAKVKSGLVSESEAYDDYFALDNLEAEKEKIKNFLEKL